MDTGKHFFRSIYKAAGARGVAIASSLVFTAISSKVIFGHYGATTFGIVTFISSLQFMIPFADMGLGAVVMNRVAENRNGNINAAFSVIYRSIKAQIIVVAILLCLIPFAVMAVGTSIRFGGSAAMSTVALAISVALILGNILLSFGNRILIGLNETHTTVYFQAMTPPLVLLGVFCISFFRFSEFYLIPLWPFVTILVSFIIALRALSKIHLSVRVLLRGILSTKISNRNDPILGTALSMLLISVASPITHNSHRLILGATRVPGALAVYSVGAQIFSPLLSLLTTAATPLWSHFSGRDRSLSSMPKLTFIFGLLGVGSSAVLLIAVPLYSWFVTGSSHYVAIDVQIAFALFLIVNSVSLPSMMKLNSGIDIKFQATVTVLACLVGLPLSLLAAGSLGTKGPILASASVMLFVQFLPMVLWQWTRRNKNSNVDLLFSQ